MRSLVAVSIACVAAGLSVAYALADPTIDHDGPSAGHGLAPSASADGHEALAPPSAVELDASVAAVVAAPVAPAAELQSAPPLQNMPANASLEPPVSSSTALDAAVADVAEDDPPAALGPPAEHSPETTAGARPTKLSVKPGLVAYLRCEGLATGRGPFPCPRDRELEARMRSIIEALPACRESAAILAGGYDVRIELGASGSVVDLDVRAPDEAADRAVRACAGAALRKQRTVLRSTRMIVSLRFKAR